MACVWSLFLLCSIQLEVEDSTASRGEISTRPTMELASLKGLISYTVRKGMGEHVHNNNQH